MCQDKCKNILVENCNRNTIKQTTCHDTCEQITCKNPWKFPLQWDEVSGYEHSYD